MTNDAGAGRRASTATLAQARDDARGRSDAAVEAMPYLPAASSPYVPVDVEPASLTWAETVAGPGYTHLTVARGTRLRLEDVGGNACAHVAIYSALNTAERLNVADTQKIPWQAYLGAGHPLLSGDGRVLATIVSDTADGHHDAFCGVTTLAGNARRYGAGEAHSATAAGREPAEARGNQGGARTPRPPAHRVLLQGRARGRRRLAHLDRLRRARRERGPGRGDAADHPDRECGAPP
ncbi:hypothetical protein GCM10025876_09120 [Demequina litorisediminis]|uniref:DUF1989 domain-containing protein n=1 Tax=Demequina litorisediminis TaxID=1849022 RepID=A0ABQ6IC92_9MICO|nr:hypothetical protein GCM10025876_09120 [Demequina litorisediminis]